MDRGWKKSRLQVKFTFVFFFTFWDCVLGWFRVFMVGSLSVDLLRFVTTS